MKIPMIIVKLIGGLGNQLFQYAFGRYLAEKNSTLLKLDITGFESYKLQKYGLHNFRINQQFASLEEIDAFSYKRKTNISKLLLKIQNRFGIINYPTANFYKDVIILKENQFCFNSSFLETKGNIYLDGYWQSEKYFMDIRVQLLKELKVIYEPSIANKELTDQILNTESVSLHIRRGDYVNDFNTAKIHGICSFEYYKKAISQMVKKNPKCHFYVFSDDQLWVKENFKIEYPFTIVNNNDASSNYEDLRLMSLCHHNIIANSSFSWWGAWLNSNPEKIIFAPKKWFNDTSLDTKDLIPESWIKI